jgi:hypothetical protein
MNFDEFKFAMSRDDKLCTSKKLYGNVLAIGMNANLSVAYPEISGGKRGSPERRTHPSKIAKI